MAVSAASGGFSDAFLILFGAQRYALSSGLAVNLSEADAGIATSIDWAFGDFSGSPSPPGNGGRMLSELPREFPLPYYSLVERLTTFGICFGVVVAMTMVFTTLWKYRLNRSIYVTQVTRARSTRERVLQPFSFVTRRRTREPHPTSAQHGAAGEGEANSRSFLAFPGIFACCKIFITGLVGPSIDLIMKEEDCHGICRAVSIASATVAAVFLLWGWLVIEL
jgi:hypothetical protein